ncbi:MAG TPA: DnaJ domain-containing protein [Anaerolineae bacterium]|nr:DnaJ domain-containing protein [Anaerolineae bacterium]MCB0222556.1 DnaJ domain-containing protein [Anaerolineae bacterium]MCB9106076.1 DnaJ domain-containing protein [Anaerolineales bacterium]HRV91305.1 DnaJ domain-containing protein [Anaerolineae bacterium]
MQASKNYYAILEVEATATENEIRRSYRVLVRKYHPDINTDPEAGETFKDIQEAYEILSDPDQRRTYDRLREAEGLDKSSSISLRAKVSHSHLLTNVDEQAFYVLMDVTPATDLPISRLPLNLCLVLDRSTSMQGMRLQQVKEGTRQIVDRLNDDDALSVVIFSDRAEVILPSQRKVDKAMAKSIVSTIQPSGGTEMFQGLQAGLDELEKNRTNSSVNHLILLTDGQTYGDEEDCLKKAEWGGLNQISLTTMGIGSDWNENLLDQMATSSGGTSVYIDSPRKIVDVFKDTIRNLSSVVARELTLSINPGEGVSLKELFQITPHIHRLDSRAEKAILGPLGTGHGKTLLMEFRIHAHATPGEKRLLRITVDSDVPGQNNRRNWEWVDIMGNFVESQQNNVEIPASIITALGKLAIFKMQEKAMDDLEKGHISAATQRLETMATRLLNLGETDLARAALLEAGRLARTGDLSAEGRKKIKYGTRSLSILPKEINRD